MCRLLVKPFEAGISGLHDVLKSVGIEQAYGPAIIIFTLGVLPCICLRLVCLPAQHLFTLGVLACSHPVPPFECSNSPD